MSTNRYLDYARWRLALQQAPHPQQSVRFFRRTLDHSRLWMVVLEGYYAGRPPSVQHCIDAVRCSRMTARRLLKDAEMYGFFRVMPAPASRRHKVVVPTALCVREYEVVVDRHLAAEMESNT